MCWALSSLRMRSRTLSLPGRGVGRGVPGGMCDPRVASSSWARGNSPDGGSSPSKRPRALVVGAGHLAGWRFLALEAAAGPRQVAVHGGQIRVAPARILLERLVDDLL